jgi:hypothetical protein
MIPISKVVFISIICCGCFTKWVESSSITLPYNADGDLSKIIPEYFDSKRTKTYYNSTPVPPDQVKALFLQGSCDVNFRLRWSTNLGSSIVSPPVLYPFQTTSSKRIFLSTFYQFIEMINFDGYKPL